MPALVIRLVSPPPKVAGYIKRYLLEVDAGLYCGALPRRVAEELVRAVSDARIRGLIAELEVGSPFGLRWIYSSGMDSSVEVDGVRILQRDEATKMVPKAEKKP